MSFLHGAWIASFLWLLVIAAWFGVLLLGLEADKPLSGDLPGQTAHHVSGYQSDWDDEWNFGDRLGETAAWVLFGAVGMLLFVLLYWIFTTHGLAL